MVSLKQQKFDIKPFLYILNHNILVTRFLHLLSAGTLHYCIHCFNFLLRLKTKNSLFLEMCHDNKRASVLQQTQQHLYCLRLTSLQYVFILNHCNTVVESQEWFCFVGFAHRLHHTALH